MNLSSQNFPKISIITPSFNQGQFLEQTILSVIDQNYPNLEYIIIDGGSTDNSVDIIKKYEHKLHFWCSEPDAGHYYAVNKGFSRATGEIFAWLNSDDMYCPWALRTVASVFNQIPEVNWLTTLSPLYWDSEGYCYGAGSIPGYSKRAFLNGLNLPWDGPWTIQQESTFWRRSVWENAGGLNLQYQLAADFDLWGQFFLQTELYGLNSPLAGFRAHRNQRSQQVENYRNEARQCLAEIRMKIGWKERMCTRLQNDDQQNRLIRKVSRIKKRLIARKNVGKNITRVVQEKENVWHVNQTEYLDVT